jgi:integrase
MNALDQFRQYLQAAGQTPGTIGIKMSYLKRLAESHPDLLTVSESDLLAWLGNPEWKPETRKSARSNLRAFYSWAHRSKLIEQDPSLYLPAVRVPAGKPKPAAETDVQSAISKAHGKQLVMVLLAAYAGLRRNEIATLRRADVTSYGLRVTGKGGRTRVVPIHPALIGPLAAYLDTHESPWVFPSDRREGEHVSSDHVYRQVREVLGHNTHTLRHRFATKAYQGSHDLRAVQELLGHSSPQTTQRYTLVETDALNAAVLSVA